ncbi:MAG: endonuclease III domain-containing protein [Candidatus Thorarchaeota archaeon]
MSGPSSKANQVCMKLIENYGSIVVERKLDPIDELVMTILSQNTNDVNMFRAYDNLKDRFPTWSEVLNASEEELGEVIRSSGFFRVKAKRIKATLREILERVGKLDLNLLDEMTIEDATAWLTSLHGVGPKTASIVLLFCFGKATLPVDTHVWRLSKRLGLVPDGTSREKTQALLEEIVPKSCVYSMNHNLIQHGREICKAINPKCSICFLNEICDFFRLANVS